MDIKCNFIQCIWALLSDNTATLRLSRRNWSCSLPTGLRTLVLVFYYMYYSENIGNFELSHIFVLMAG